MSLHAQLSPEAQARLDAQRRNSTISSIVISILFMTLLGMVLAFILIRPWFMETPVIVTYHTGVTLDDDLDPRRLTTQIHRNPSAPSSSMARVIAANTSSPTAVPVPEIHTPDPSADFGSGLDFGDGWGSMGDGGGPSFGHIPAALSKRCTHEDRMERLLEGGGTPQCDEAVVRGLDWLQRTQAPDGSWGQGNKSAMTGLALLAYLGRCETPLSEQYGDTVLRGLMYLINLGMENNGKLIPRGGEKNKHWPYEHAIATYALGEATTLNKQFGIDVPNLRDVTQQAGQFIIDNQHKSGGWDYGYSESSGRGGDLSIAAWQLQALKACHHTGLEFRNLRRTVSRALDYVLARRDSSGGFGYAGTSPAGNTGGYHTLTGAGMLALQMWDRGSHTAVRAGARYIEKFGKFDYNSEFCDLYGHYYDSQAMMNRGGEQWKRYNEMFRDQLLDNQNPDGSWKNPGGGRQPRAVGAQFIGNSPQAVHYRTCLAILMLEVYYRYLPGTMEGTPR